MKTLRLIAAVSAAWMLPSSSFADLYVTNFTSLNGSFGASGVWRNVTTATDTTVPVGFAQMGGTVRPADGSSQRSVIDDSFQWQDIPAFPPFIPAAMDVFNPNYDGDYINVEVLGGGASLVVINFQAVIIDPVLNFTDVDTQTTLVFSNPFTVVGKTPNLSQAGNVVTTNGVTIPIFDEECAGSLKFQGAHSRLVFFIVNSGPSPTGDDDRTGFSVATETAPAPPQLLVSDLTLYTNATQIMLTWPIGSVTALRYSTNLGNPWMELPGHNPAAGAWVGDKSLLGGNVFIRGHRKF